MNRTFIELRIPMVRRRADTCGTVLPSVTRRERERVRERERDRDRERESERERSCVAAAGGIPKHYRAPVYPAAARVSTPAGERPLEGNSTRVRCPSAVRESQRQCASEPSEKRYLAAHWAHESNQDQSPDPRRLETGDRTSQLMRVQRALQRVRERRLGAPDESGESRSFPRCALSSPLLPRRVFGLGVG
jgi:hypothetical protein